MALPRNIPDFSQIKIAGQSLPTPFIETLKNAFRMLFDLRDYVLNTNLFVDDEIPSGTANGTNKTFTLGSAPAPPNSLRLYRNGILLTFGSDFTLTGQTLTLLSAPASTDSLLAYYRRTQTTPNVTLSAAPVMSSVTSTPSSTNGSLFFADDETPGGAINGVNTAYTLAFTPAPPTSLIFVINGVVQLPGTDYTLSASTVTMTVAPIAGDWIRAWYRY